MVRKRTHVRKYTRRRHGTADHGGEVSDHDRGYEAAGEIKAATEAARETDFRLRRDEKIKQVLDTLSYEMVDAKPVDFNFGEGYGETWDVPMELTEEEMDNEEWLPMMNYMYPLPDDFEIPDDWRDKMNNTTIVQVRDGYYEKYYLALTGGGMDLSWEICQTYINLGYYPPAHFCRLPRMAGKDYDSFENRLTIEACKGSLNAVKGWQDSRLADLERMTGTE